MFCSGCGVQIDAALNYCNRCGNRVSKGNDSSVADNLSQALTYIGTFGLLGLVILAAILIRKDSLDTLVPVSFFYLTAVVTICWLLIRHSTQLTKLKLEAGRPTEKSPEPHYLSPRTTAQLNEPTQEPASVVEHTTRTLDKIPLDR